MSYVSFTFFLFFVVYCIPLIILVTANTITLRGLKQMRDKIENGIQTVMSRKRIESERRIVKSRICSVINYSRFEYERERFDSVFFFISGIIITTCGFIFTWTPYAVTLFISAFRGKDYAIPPMVTFFCACFAKSSVIWIPMLYIGTSTQFKLNFVNRDSFEQQWATNRIDANPNGNGQKCNRKFDQTSIIPVAGPETLNIDEK